MDATLLVENGKWKMKHHDNIQSEKVNCTSINVWYVFSDWLHEWTWKTCRLSRDVCTETESWSTVKTLHRNSHWSVLRVSLKAGSIACFFCFVLLATHSCFRGGPESLCSGITPNVSEWIRVIQRHKVQSEIFRDFSEILQRLRKHARQFPWRSSISVGKWNSVTRITHLEGTKGKSSPKSYRIRFKEIPMATIHGQNDPVVLPCLFFSGQGPDIPPFFVVKKVEGRSRYCSHAGSYRITTGPWRILCRIHTWKTVSRLWVFSFPIGHLNWFCCLHA